MLERVPWRERVSVSVQVFLRRVASRVTNHRSLFKLTRRAIIPTLGGVLEHQADF